MKTLLTSCRTACILTALAAFLSPSISCAQQKTTLRVLCYNIHYGQGTDGVYDVPRLAEVIRRTKPDLVALQEVDVGVKRSDRMHEARMLGELTGMAVRFGPTQHYEGGLFGNAVLTRLPILDVHIQPLPYSESTPERTTYPRGATAVKVRTDTGREITFVSTHFQHNVEEDRVAEAHAVNSFFASDSGTWILAGDINAVPGSEPVTILESKWTNAIDAEAAPSAPAGQPRSRIDYIFYRGPGLQLISSEVVAEPVASDHRPVLAVFEQVD